MILRILSIACFSLLCGPAAAQDFNVFRIGSSSGDYTYHGSDSGIATYSFATTSCNVGSVPVDWNDDIGQAPVIGQNLFRIYDGKIEQLGYSWLKVGFCAVNENGCGTCQDTDCNTLGVGCADTYGSFLNDGQDGVAKFEINPTTGTVPLSPTVATGTLPLRGRLQVQESEMAQAGSIYVAEGQYVSEDDHMAGNARNNVAWRRLTVNSLSSISNFGLTNIGDPAIFAWADVDPGVMVREVVNIDEGGTGIHGYYFVGSKATDVGGGMWRYEYAVQNYNSDRAVGTFSVPVDCATVQPASITFRDVDKHSGSPYSNVDWTWSTAGGVVFWETEQFAQNADANALRWGTLYNFGFTSDQGPRTADAELGLFKPGTPTSLSVEVVGPCGEPICGYRNYCASTPNSASSGALMDAFGDTSISGNNLTIAAVAGVPNVFGLFFYGPNQVQVTFGDGNRCVGGVTRRLQPPTQADVFGDFTKSLDLLSPPFSSGGNAVTPGSTWNFQLWFRDPMGPGGNGFNLSDGLEVTFCP